MPIEATFPLLLPLSLFAAIVSLGSLGMLIATTFVLYRHANALGNLLEYPIWLITGLLVPISVLPLPGLPDMVYAANGAFSVDGTVYGARFRHPQRRSEAAAHHRFYLDRGWTYIPASETNEGEGDFAYVPGVAGGVILAGYGFRTEVAAHAEAQEALGRPVVSLRLVDPRFYHLDTALAVLDDRRITYFPGAFSAAAQRILAQLFPDALLADDTDALDFGLNLVSDGRHVVLADQRPRRAAAPPCSRRADRPPACR